MKASESTAPAPGTGPRTAPRKRVLIVNCYLDDTRDPVARPHKFPQSMGPVFLAGAFAPDRCDVRLYNEQSGGPLEDPRLLAWPDMLVLTGLVTSLDRMLHVTAYARTRNPRVVVVAGGHAVRAFPRFCERFCDYVCLGDVEELRDVAREALGSSYVSEEVAPRFELADWVGRVGYVETSRYCNFRCSFCSLTAEGRRFHGVELGSIRRQFERMGRRSYVIFLDNNFYGPDRRHFRAKLDLIREFRERGLFTGWSALVTGDFFLDDENLERVRQAGCKALFSGVESLDEEWLARANKAQNLRRSPLETIRATTEAGIVFLYGLMLDVTSRSTAAIRDELEFILGRPDLTLPSYVSLPIPMPGTPFFYECLEDGRLLPDTWVRDLDGSTLSLRPRDSLPTVLRFMREHKTFRAYWTKTLSHGIRFARRYRKHLDPPQMALALSNAAALCAPGLSSGLALLRRGRTDRTYVSTTEVLDRVYTPAFPVASAYAHHFRPTRLTDADGALSEDVAPDLLPSRAMRQGP